MECRPVLEIWAVSSANESRLEDGACHGIKNIGKPCAGELHTRVDEGEQVRSPMTELLRHRQAKGAETDRFDQTVGEPVSYSTQ